MRKSKSLIGLSIVGQTDGTQLGRVRDLIFDHEANQVLALVLSERDLFGLVEAHIVPWREVQSVGKDMVLVKNGDSQIPLREDKRVRALIDTHRDTILSGTQIFTSGGEHLGTLADMVIDEQTGRVTGYEMSGGFMADTLHGKKFLPGSTELAFGQDAAIVPPEAADELQNLQKQNLQK